MAMLVITRWYIYIYILYVYAYTYVDHLGSLWIPIDAAFKLVPWTEELKGITAVAGKVVGNRLTFDQTSATGTVPSAASDGDGGLGTFWLLGRRISLELPTSQVWTNFTLSFPGKIGFQTHLQVLFISRFFGSIVVSASFHSSFVCLIFVPRSIPETTSLIANVKWQNIVSW